MKNSTKIYNFQDETAIELNFKPLKNSLPFEEKSVMTDDIRFYSKQTETKQESNDIEQQTDAQNSNQVVPDYDENDLLMFLRRKNKLFKDSFLEQSTLSESESWFKAIKISNQTNLIMSLKLGFGKEKEKIGFQINQIALNTKGMALAIAVGCKKHEGSCEHTAFVSGWHISRTNIKLNEPHWTITVNGCVTSISWHPRRPTIFAVGTVNGVINIYDIGNFFDIYVYFLTN